MCFAGTQELLNEASSQYCIQRQAQALLHICSDENPIDEVEAERIVLLAGTTSLEWNASIVTVISQSQGYTLPLVLSCCLAADVRTLNAIF